MIGAQRSQRRLRFVRRCASCDGRSGCSSRPGDRPQLAVYQARRAPHETRGTWRSSSTSRQTGPNLVSREAPGESVLTLLVRRPRGPGGGHSVGALDGARASSGVLTLLVPIPGRECPWGPDAMPMGAGRRAAYARRPYPVRYQSRSVFDEPLARRRASSRCKRRENSSRSSSFFSRGVLGEVWLSRFGGGRPRGVPFWFWPEPEPCPAEPWFDPFDPFEP
jgi:hypothetical protein